MFLHAWCVHLINILMTVYEKFDNYLAVASCFAEMRLLLVIAIKPKPTRFIFTVHFALKLGSSVVSFYIYKNM